MKCPDCSRDLVWTPWGTYECSDGKCGCQQTIEGDELPRGVWLYAKVPEGADPVSRLSLADRGKLIWRLERKDECLVRINGFWLVVVDHDDTMIYIGSVYRLDGQVFVVRKGG